jgi:hypothetical protein
MELIEGISRARRRPYGTAWETAPCINALRTASNNTGSLNY